MIEELEQIPFTSRFKVDEEVILNFGISGQLTKCKVAGVSFIDGRVLYHIDVTYEDNVSGNFTHRIVFVNSIHVEPVEISSINSNA